VRQRAPDLPDLAGVERSSHDGDLYELWTADSDALVRQLVTTGVPFRNLEVATASLEDAFLALTSPDNQTRALTEEMAR
jgi:ABC-2 type transport system ATP-binding protein